MCLFWQGQKIKKESDVGMLLTGKRKHRNWQAACRDQWCSLVYKAQKQAACRGAAYWVQNTEKKLHVGCHNENQCDETIRQSLSEPDSNPLHQ